MNIQILSILNWLSIVSILFSSQVYSSEYVILLHGLARTDHSMEKLAESLDNAGYTTLNIKYPSTKYHIEKLADDAITEALNLCPEDTKINFVTHSLGGILVRQYLSKNTIQNLGRVVMIGPPNKGSKVVDNLHWVPGYKLINGPAGNQLGTSKNSLPNSLGPARFNLGIIAGNRSVNPILSLMLEKPNDGKVSVESSKLSGMNDHIELPVTHTFMMNNKTVISQVIYFLRNGAFEKV